MKRYLVASISVIAISFPAALFAHAGGDADLIKSAESAAPASVAGGAAIYAVTADGSMKTLREGTNGFWCMPDSPATPGPDPMCGDANAMEWAMAWIGKKGSTKRQGWLYVHAGWRDRRQ